MKRAGAIALLALTLLSACGSATTNAVDVGFDVRLVGVAPFTVRAEGGGRLERDAKLNLAIVFESTRERATGIDDVRWTFAGRRDDGVFATAGHGCGPGIDEETGRVRFACTSDYRYLIVRPDEVLRETVTAFGRVDGKPLATGTFTFRQQIKWWLYSGEAIPRTGSTNLAEVVLTFRVTRAG